MMICWNNNHKDKSDSYEVFWKEDDKLYDSFVKKYPDVYASVYGHGMEHIIGYGETKKEAIDNFRIALRYLIDEFQAIEKLYLETPFLENNMVEVDCLGNPLENSNGK